MKRVKILWIAIVCVTVMLAGCGAQERPAGTDVTTTENVTQIQAEEETTAQPSSAQAVEVPDFGYPHYQKEMSAYYLSHIGETVGYALLDLDGDGVEELFMGDMEATGKDAVIDEIWTLKNDVPVSLGINQEKECYYLIYLVEDGIYMLANEGEKDGMQSYYYYILVEGKLELVQGIVYDGTSQGTSKWFTTMDTDRDVQNDMETDEEMAQSIIASYDNYIIVPEYCSFTDAAVQTDMDTTEASTKVPEGTELANTDLETLFMEGMQDYASKPCGEPVMIPETDMEYLNTFYPGLAEISLRQFYIAMAPVTNAPMEIAMVEVADAADVDAVITIFENRVDDMSKNSAYPEDGKVWANNAIVSASGNFVFLAVMTDDFGIADVFVLE